MRENIQSDYKRRKRIEPVIPMAQLNTGSRFSGGMLLLQQSDKYVIHFNNSLQRNAA